MRELQRVRPRRSFVERHLAVAAAPIIVVLVAVILKPWGPGAEPLIAVPASLAPPSTTPGPSGARTHSADLGFGDLVYDPAIFGVHEPPAVWDLRPAAFLVTFGFVFELPSAEPVSRLASVPPSVSSDGGPSWPTQVFVPRGYHLFLFGIDMPRGYRLEAASLTLISGAGAPRTIPTSPLDSPWPDHFAVIGVPSTVAPGRQLVWPAGEYRLDLAFEPGAIERSLTIVIGA